MRDIYFLPEDSADFPPPSLLSSGAPAVVGSDLRPSTLIAAYKKGYFPWYNKDEPRCWYHPRSRMVLFPEDLIVSKSMRPYLHGNKFIFKIDKHFRQVVQSCGGVKRWNGETNSWITDEIVESYGELFKSGYAHCAETWNGNQLVGGLYGVQLGNVFFGESMFSTESNSSKFAFILFVRYLIKQGIRLIDCQQETSHLASLGAQVISREDFVGYLEKFIPDNENIW